VYQPISYSAESFIDVDLRYPDAHASLEPLRKTCDWLVANQVALSPLEYHASYSRRRVVSSLALRAVGRRLVGRFQRP